VKFVPETSPLIGASTSAVRPLEPLCRLGRRGVVVHGLGFGPQKTMGDKMVISPREMVI